MYVLNTFVFFYNNDIKLNTFVIKNNYSSVIAGFNHYFLGKSRTKINKPLIYECKPMYNIIYRDIIFKI